MSTQYVSTFITGFENVVEKGLKQILDDFKTNLKLDGLIGYSTSSNTDKVKNIKFLNNTFLPIHIFKKSFRNSIDGMMRHILDNVELDKTLNGAIYRKHRAFRIVTSDKNKFVSPNKKLLVSLESKITEITNLEPDRSYPDIEFWFLLRSESFGFFGLRLTRHPDFTKSLPKGELRPELAHILCLMSEMKTTDVFLDPFAGHGSIPQARSRYPYRQILAFDNDSRMVKKLRSRLNILKNTLVSNSDATKLEGLRNNSINKIVTDPPWGHFLGKNLNIEKFYSQMLDSLYRVLKKSGIAVILIGEKELFEKLLEEISGEFCLMEKYDTLVSGHKAGIYKIIKIS